jgi:hypothetical protein
MAKACPVPGVVQCMSVYLMTYLLNSVCGGGGGGNYVAGGKSAC